MGEVNIRPVRGERELAAFVELPWQVYRDCHWWVPPLRKEVRELLDTAKNPFWQHAERELFAAWEDGRVVGRIAAITDRNHDAMHEERAGFFGFFECLEDYRYAEPLFAAARDWCASRGAAFLRGPASPSSNDEYGFLLEGYSSRPVVMMPYNPPYYVKYAERFGFTKAKDLWSLIKCTHSGIPDRLERMMKRIKRTSRFTIRAFDPKHFDRDVAIIKQIYNGAWERNWGFVPLTEAEMDAAAKKLRDFIDPRLIIIGEFEGRPAGIALSLPNVNEVLVHLDGRLGPLEVLKFLWHRRRIRGMRCVLGGCLKEFRQTGLIAELFYETFRNAEGRYEWGELGWNLEDNDLINAFDTEIGGQVYKKYRVCQLPLSPVAGP